MNANPEVRPVVVGTGTDFTGTPYEIEELPPVDEVQEGTYCTVYWPGDSGWYETEYQCRNGAWEETMSTAPWQLGVGV